MKLRRLYFLPSLLLIVSSLYAQEPCQPGDMRILSGKSSEGYYFKVAAAIAEVARTRGLTVCAMPSSETLKNVSKLISDPSKPEFAIAQSDVAREAWLGFGEFKGHRAKELRIVSPLYAEPVHILYGPRLPITQIRDLKGRRIYLGPANSGTAFAAEHILSSAGLVKGKDYKSVDAPNYCKVVERMKDPDGGIDAAFRATLVPSAEIQDAFRRDLSGDPSECGGPSEIQMLTLPYDLVKQLADDGSYAAGIIHGDVYRLPYNTRTVAVEALLLTNLPVDDPKVEALAKILRQNRVEIQQTVVRLVQQQHNGQHAGTTAQLALVDSPIDPSLLGFVHPMARNYVLTWDVWWRKLVITLTMLSGALVFFTWLNKRWIRRLFAIQPQLIVLAMFTVAIWLASCVVLFRYESATNEHFDTLARSLRYSFLYLVELPGYDLLTNEGQACGQVARWLSLALVGGFVAPLMRQMIDMLGKHSGGDSADAVAR